MIETGIHTQRRRRSAALPATAVADAGTAGWAIAAGMLERTKDVARSNSGGLCEFGDNRRTA